jgi:F-type H+-transporting ATPase subunit delta
MSDLTTLARPYAQAVFKLAKEEKATEKWSEALSYLSLLMQDGGMLTVVKNPRIEKKRIIRLILDIAEDKLSEKTVNFVKLLVHNDRLLLAPQIAELFEQYKSEDEGYVDVELKSAFALTKAEENSMTETLEKILQKTVHMNANVDKTLIGGFLARAGDFVIDGSIKGRLQQLSKRL